MKALPIALVLVLASAFALSFFPATASANVFCNGTYLDETLNRTIDGVLHTYYTHDLCMNGCDLKLARCSESQWTAITGPIGNWGLIGLVCFFIVFIVLLAKLATR